MRFYFQWTVMIFIHGLLFFYLPIHGNFKVTNQGYCDTSEYILASKDSLCNNFNRNIALMFFYLLCCAYLWISALQIKKGLPEVMHIYFMMGQYDIFHKSAFLGFMNIPFIYELRVFIDWTYTKTSLDVF
jgi:hypothetical protein